MDCYVDADCVGLWLHKNKQDPLCVKSRTGFAICIANCPVMGSSKLQSDICHFDHGSRVYCTWHGNEICLAIAGCFNSHWKGGWNVSTTINNIQN